MKWAFVIALFCSLSVPAQTSKAKHDSVALIKKYLSEYALKGDTFKKSKDTPGQFENQGRWHSSYIILHSDSTFVYYSVFEGGYDLTLGNWRMNGQKNLVLNWDSAKTRQAVSDKAVYGQYFKYSRPSPHPIPGSLCAMYADSLVWLKK